MFPVAPNLYFYNDYAFKSTLFLMVDLLLQRKDCVVIRRKLVIQNEGISWLYGCSCNPFQQIYIDGLSFDSDYVQKDEGL